MNRLTKKAQFVRNLITGKEIKYISNESDQMCVDKLGALEDIEEELGIDLITLFKALKDGIDVYYEYEERYQFHNNLRLEYHKTLGWGLVDIFGSICRNDMPMKLDMEFYELKEYQKTWFLKEDRCEEETKDE